MNPRSNDPSPIPAGLTPLVQMFPMYIGEPAPAQAPGVTTRLAASPERAPTPPARSMSHSG